MKKAIILFLIVSLIPMTTIAEKVDPVDDFSDSVSESWQEAKGIWAKLYLYSKEFWFKHIDWRITPLKRWIKTQTDKLSAAFKKDVKDVEDSIKEETKEAGKGALRKIWEIIANAIGKKSD